MHRKHRSLFAQAFLVLGFLIGLLSAAVRVSSAALPPVDPQVWEDTDNGQVGNFLVILKLQAGTRMLGANAPDHVSQGRAVMNTLMQAADATQASVRSQLDLLGASYRTYWVVNALAVKGNRDVLNAMLARTDVAEIDSNRSFRVARDQVTASPSSALGIEWNISKVGAPSVWGLGYTGQGIVYAAADTGVQWDHPALKSHYRGWNGTAANHNYNWWDAIHNNTIDGGSSCGYNLQSPCDDYAHGTHTMGTGVGDDGAGNQIGMAPGAKWIACRNTDNGWGRPSTYIECLQFFLAPTDLNGANPNPSKRPDVISNSYDCNPIEGCAPHALQTAVENLRAAGVFVAAAAGNAGSCGTISTPPALEDSVITVGATTNDDTIFAGSSRGPVTIDGSNRRKPDLVAPGYTVRSSVPTNSYTTEWGTSMAAPHVAGAVALLWSAFPKIRGNVDLTENILEQSAVHLTTTEGCGGDTTTQVPNNTYGYGRLDVWAAYNYARSLPGVFYNDFLPWIKR